MDVGRALSEPRDRHRRQLEPERRDPDPVRGSACDDLSAAVGGRRRTRWCSPASCSPQARSATVSAGRARCNWGSSASSSPRCSPPRRPRCGRSSLSRALMGACAAFIMPSTLSILVNVFGPHERTKAIAIWAGVTGGAGALGPLASGWLLGHFWYGSVFLVNVPIVLIALVLGAFLVPTSQRSGGGQARSRRRGSFDRRDLVARLRTDPGARRRMDEWRATRRVRARRASCSPLFVWWESRVDEPMLDMKYFRNPAFSTATAGLIARLPVDVRRDVPLHAVLPAHPRLQPALGRGAVLADRADHDDRLTAHAADQRPLRLEPNGCRRHDARRRSGSSCSR